MGDKQEYSQRADAMADVLRRFLVGLNTGGIAVSMTFAANLAEKNFSPSWVVCPVVAFVCGLGLSGASMLYAKHKALKRRNAADAGKDIPKYDGILQRNFTWDFLTLVIFLIGAVVGLMKISGLH